MEPDPEKELWNGEQRAPAISSSEFARKFGQLRQMQDDQAIVVTHHGRGTHVLTTVRHYAALQQSKINDSRESILTASVQELANCLNIGVLLIDYELRIIVANRVAHVQLDCTDGELSGRKVFEALPVFQESLIETYVKRSIASKEPYSAEIPSLFRKDTWVRAEIYPFSKYVTVLFHDITDDMKVHRLADARKSLREAIAVHDGISYVCVNTRGHIEQAEPAFCDILRLSEDRLLHVALADLIPVSQRVAFREALDRVLSGEGTRTIDSAVLSNDGRELPVRLTLAELRGIYGNEGAIALLTER